VTECFDDIEMHPIEWLWPGNIARGKVTMIAGDPGLGKSQITLNFAATISNGGEWPDGTRAPKGTVLVISSEDTPDDIIKPRLVAAGANMKNVQFLRQVEERDERGRTVFTSLSLERHLDILDAKLRELKDAVYIPIDPMSAHLGAGIDNHRDSHVRAMLAPAVQILGSHGTALVGVGHLTKPGNGANPRAAMYSLNGALAFIAAARAGYLVVKDKENGDWRRLFLPIKNNLDTDNLGFAYRIVTEYVTNSAGERIKTARIVWEPDKVIITADEALRQMSMEGRKSSRMDEAKGFLMALLGKGPYPAAEVERLAKDAGIKEKTLDRASKALGVQKVKDGMDGPWIWSLMTTPTPTEPPDRPPGTKMAMFPEHENMTILTTFEDGQSQPVSPLEYEEGQILCSKEGWPSSWESWESGVLAVVLPVSWHDPDGMFDADAMLAQGWKRLDGDWWVFPPSVGA
jgi:hypothetical protein